MVQLNTQNSTIFIKNQFLSKLLKASFFIFRNIPIYIILTIYRRIFAFSKYSLILKTAISTLPIAGNKTGELLGSSHIEQLNSIAENLTTKSSCPYFLESGYISKLYKYLSINI